VVNVLYQSATQMARRIQAREISSVELISAHVAHIKAVNSSLNAVVELLEEPAMEAARQADQVLAAGRATGPLHGVPFSIKDSIDVAGSKTTAGTIGRKDAAVACCDATLVRRLKEAGGIALAKTNLPDLLFAYESDNFIYGRSNNPYDLTRTPGGSSGGESALIAAGGTPLGLGSDAAGSVRLPAAFCGITSIKPTSGRLPRTGHVPPAGGWAEALWQMGPMARFTEDLVLAMRLLAREDDQDFTAPPMPLLEPVDLRKLRVAFFSDNGFAPCSPEIKNAVEKCAAFMEREGAAVTEHAPPGIARAYDLEMALLGADGADGIDGYLTAVGSNKVHPLLTYFVDQMRPHRVSASQFGEVWAHWDAYRSAMRRFFLQYDVVLSPVYTQTALKHGESMRMENFRGFSYTMAWNVAGYPAATVRCAAQGKLPINVQVVTKPWHDLLALQVCRAIESCYGGWQKA
jgi:amidase